MQKLIFRLVALVLVPCLMTDPGRAAVFSHEVPAARAPQVGLDTQALAPTDIWVPPHPGEPRIIRLLAGGLFFLGAPSHLLGRGETSGLHSMNLQGLSPLMALIGAVAWSDFGNFRAWKNRLAHWRWIWKLDPESPEMQVLFAAYVQWGRVSEPASRLAAEILSANGPVPSRNIRDIHPQILRELDAKWIWVVLRKVRWNAARLANADILGKVLTEGRLSLQKLAINILTANKILNEFGRPLIPVLLVKRPAAARRVVERILEIYKGLSEEAQAAMRLEQAPDDLRELLKNAGYNGVHDDTRLDDIGQKVSGDLAIPFAHAYLNQRILPHMHRLLNLLKTLQEDVTLEDFYARQRILLAKGVADRILTNEFSRLWSGLLITLKESTWEDYDGRNESLLAGAVTKEIVTAEFSVMLSDLLKKTLKKSRLGPFDARREFVLTEAVAQRLLTVEDALMLNCILYEPDQVQPFLKALWPAQTEAPAPPFRGPRRGAAEGSA